MIVLLARDASLTFLLGLRNCWAEIIPAEVIGDDRIISKWRLKMKLTGSVQDFNKTDVSRKR